MFDPAWAFGFSPYLFIVVLAFLAGVFGGLSGYGSGLILPPFLLPITGPEPIVPVIAISALMINSSRIVAFREAVDWKRVAIVVVSALPTCILGAGLYASLSGPVITLLIGASLVVLVPLRRLAMRAQLYLRGPALVLASAGYGLLVGATAGSGVVLITIMLASGIGGVAVVATDAAISLILGVTKIGVFQATGILSPAIWAMALLIGLSATPGAYIAKMISRRMPVHVHNTILDGVVIFGGVVLIVQGLSG